MSRSPGSNSRQREREKGKEGLDRSVEITNKRRRRGVCFYINKRYCKTVIFQETICTPDFELLTISLCPYYLPREFQQLFFTVVYIHPRANASTANQLIGDVTQRLDTICLDAPKFVLGDFNHYKLDRILKTYEQYVSCATTQKHSTIDLCYGSVGNAYKSLPMSSFGASYHNSVLLVSVYRPSFKPLQPMEKTMKCWSVLLGISTLQTCFEGTSWNVFFDTVGDSIEKSVINKKKQTYFTGDPQKRKMASREMQNEIRRAKAKYKEKIEMQYTSGNLQAAWHGIKTMASINQCAIKEKQSISVNGIDDLDLPDAFNWFFSRFEIADFLDKVSLLKSSLVPQKDILISQECVTGLLKRSI